MKRRMIAWMLLLTPFTDSCDGDGGIKTGNGIDTTLRAVSSYGPAPEAAAGTRGAAAPMLPAPDAHEPPTVFEFEEIRLNVERLEFRLPSGTTCNDYNGFPFVPPVSCAGVWVRVEGPLVADLVTGGTTPSLGELYIPSGTYNRADVRVRPASEGDVEPGDPLEGNSIHATGSFDYGGQGRTFEFVLSFTDNLRFENEDGIEITAGGFDQVLLDMDVALWFSGLPITQCIIDGELIIDGSDHLVIEDASEPSSPCKNIENELEQAVKASGKLNKEP